MNRNWKDFYWTTHVLLRIAEYGWRLRDVFEAFENAEVIKKNEDLFLKDFVKHGGIKGANSIILEYFNRGFILKEKAVVTTFQIPYGGVKKKESAQDVKKT